MSDQVAVSDGRESEFGLIETLLWTNDIGFHLLPEHLARLAASSATLNFVYHEARALEALEGAVKGEAARLRVRLVLTKNGAIETSATEIEPTAPGTIWRAAIARRRFSSLDPLLRHKTTSRALYEDELAEAARRQGADEVIFLNERDEVCESARCNVFLERNGAMETPPLTCGLLPGTRRARLLAEGLAREAVLRPADLSGGFLLGNSVRGLVRATLLR